MLYCVNSRVDFEICLKYLFNDLHRSILVFMLLYHFLSFNLCQCSIFIFFLGTYIAFVLYLGVFYHLSPFNYVSYVIIYFFILPGTIFFKDTVCNWICCWDACGESGNYSV